MKSKSNIRFWILSVLFACLVWIGMYFALFKLHLGFGRVSAFSFSTLVVSVMLWVDYKLISITPIDWTDRHYFLVILRVLMTAGVAWVAAYGYSINLMWDVFQVYRPSSKSSQYLVGFYRMIRSEDSVFYLFVTMAAVIFLFDALSRLLLYTDTQNQVVTNQKEIIIEQQQLMTESQLQLDALNQNLIIQMRSIKHELGNKLSTSQNTIADLYTALANLEETLPGFRLDSKIRQRFPNESTHNIDSYRDLTVRLSSNLKYSLTFIDRIEDLVSGDPASFKPELFDVRSWIVSELPKYILQDEYCDFDAEYATINADRKQLTIAVKNIIENARRHGFTASEIPKKILVEVKKEASQVFFSIHNSGKALPSDFSMDNFRKPGQFSGVTGNSGFGGYLIGIIVQNHNAVLRVLPSDKNGYSTKVEIVFL